MEASASEAAFAEKLAAEAATGAPEESSPERPEYLDEEGNVVPVESFDDMGLDDGILRAVYSYGFEKPSQIQRLAIRPVADRRDVIAQAQSGTGKTAAYVIGSMCMINPEERSVQILIIVHTHELALQVFDYVGKMGKFIGVKSCLAIGKMSLRDQVSAIRGGAQVVVGTPGRLFDLFTEQLAPGYLNNLKRVVVDEADELLSSSFEEQVTSILKIIPRITRIALFSATLDDEVLHWCDRFMQHPVKVLLRKEEVSLEGISQYRVNLKEQFKLAVILDLYSALTPTQSIIFCGSKQRVDELAADLTRNHFPVTKLHSDLLPEERRAAVATFRTGASRVLVTTDLVARGFDVQQVSLVINYDFPPSTASYIHRIGRSGRLGRKGTAISLVTASTEPMVAEVEAEYKIKIPELPELSEISVA